MNRLRKTIPVLLTFTIASAVGLLVAAVFALVNFLLPSLALFTIGTVAVVLRNRIGLPDRPITLSLAILSSLIIVVPASFFGMLWEAGMDDGPFRGRPLRGELASSKADYSTPYRSGQLLIFNRGKNQAPVLAYERARSVEWAREMYVSFAGHGPAMWEMSDPEIEQGTVRDTLIFTADWTFGKETGVAYIWRFGGLHRFYLSW